MGLEFNLTFGNLFCQSSIWQFN